MHVTSKPLKRNVIKQSAILSSRFLKEPWGPGTFSTGVKQPELVADDRPGSKSEVKNEWGSTSNLAHASKPCTGTGLHNNYISVIFASLSLRQYINSLELFSMCVVGNSNWRTLSLLKVAVKYSGLLMAHIYNRSVQNKNYSEQG